MKKQESIAPYQYSAHAVQGSGYNPSVNKDIDLDPEDAAEKLQKLVDTMVISPPENKDIETSDELDKDNAHAKAFDDVDPEINDKLIKSAAIKAKEIEKISSQYESVLNDVCSGNCTLDEAVLKFVD